MRGLLYALALLLAIGVFARARSPKLRQAALLILSYALYATWEPWFLMVLLASTSLNFLLGEWLRRKQSAWILWSAILLNVSLLGLLKYLPGITGNSSLFLHGFSKIAVPLGISFWTFQAMSYLFDVYRGEQLIPSLAEFALYMSFFPVTISGPICRLPELLPQFRRVEPLMLDNVAAGLRRIATGVLMMLLARLLGQGIAGGDGINSGFDRLTVWSGSDVWCLTFGFGLQLFLDFAGYSHIAIGAAKMIGIILPENFARPFQSTSPSIFWARWHMSLSFWIRDYVFLPLVMLRRERWWRNLILIVSMVLFGLWHKATWLFLLWGLYHGILLVLHRQIDALQRRFDWTPPAIWAPFSWLATISLISGGWIFFRANSLPQARTMVSAIFSPAYRYHNLSSSLYALVVLIAMAYAGVLLAADALRHHENPAASGHTTFITRVALVRWYWVPPLYVLALLSILMITLTQSGDAAQLMYRKF